VGIKSQLGGMVRISSFVLREQMIIQMIGEKKRKEIAHKNK
jgi:hypothetical protein